MLFSEIYSSYFNAVAKILGLATESKLTGKALTEAIQEQAFEESVLVIPKALKSERWPPERSKHRCWKNRQCL